MISKMFALHYHQLLVRITPAKEVKITGWLGAVIRNNLLFAADRIMLPDEKKSLREFVAAIPLREDHPFYAELQNGFPAPYTITLNSHAQSISPVKELKKGEIISFTLCLTGTAATHSLSFLQTIREMCRHGMGTPVTPFLLIDVCELSPHNELNLLMTGENILTSNLKYPVTLEPYKQPDNERTAGMLQLNLTTPTKLYRPSQKTDTQISYQDKLNGFPSFYQFVRSAAFRFFKLNILYLPSHNPEHIKPLQDELEHLIEKAVSPTLYSADIQQVVLPNTLKKETINKINLSGYVGTLSFQGDFNDFMPLLLFMQNLGVGHDVVYGLGKYEVKIIH